MTNKLTPDQRVKKLVEDAERADKAPLHVRDALADAIWVMLTSAEVPRIPQPEPELRRRRKP